jgi:hypothetical protein
MQSSTVAAGLKAGWALGVHRLLLPAFVAGLVACGPRVDDDAGGGAGEGPSTGQGGGGSSAGGGVAGSSGEGGAAEMPLGDQVIGCAATSWPDAGLYFEPTLVGESPPRAEWLQSRMFANGISGDGRIVVGQTSDPPYREIAVSWSLAGGIIELPEVTMDDNGNCCFEARGVQASCDGSVILQQDAPFHEIYRTEGDEAPVVLYGSPYTWVVSMTPDASVIVDGVGQQGELGGSPLRWTAATGMADVSGLFLEAVYGVAPDGTLIAGNADQLFEYDVTTDVRTPIGMAAVDFVKGSPFSSLKVSADGKAWAQSADRHYDSFLVWRPGAEPRSVTCPGPCQIVDISGTGEVVRVDVTRDSATTSSIWTQRSGFIDLTTVFEQLGANLAGRKLRAVAMSDDGRAVTGFSGPDVNSARFFYGVLPVSIYE